jgi:hypothetical protein
MNRTAPGTTTPADALQALNEVPKWSDICRLVAEADYGTDDDSDLDDDALPF